MHLIYYTKHSWISRKQRTVSKQSIQDGTFKQAFISTLTGEKRLSVCKVYICVYVNGCNFAIWPINVKYSHTKCYLKGSVFCIHSCCRRYMLLKYCRYGVKHYPSNTFMLNAQSCTFTNFTTEYKRFTRLHGLCNFFFQI